MEEQLVREEETVSQPKDTAIQKQLLQRVLLYSSLGLAVVSIFFLILLYQNVTNAKSVNDTQQATINSQKEQIASLTAFAAQITDIDAKTKTLATMSFILYVQHYVEGGIVTDDLTVAKLHLDTSDDNKLSVTIDVDNQPQMAAHYKGSGGYDLTDRELRAKSTELIAKVKESYVAAAGDNGDLPKWDDSHVYLTVKNFAIGDSTSGEFSLVGEKK